MITERIFLNEVRNQTLNLLVKAHFQRMNQTTSSSTTLPTTTYSDLVELGRRLYEMSLVRRDKEMITDPRGQPIGWLLDTRIPMLEGRIFQRSGRSTGRTAAIQRD